MRKKPILGTICLVSAGVFVYFATELRRSAPLLTIVKTSFPTCETRTYTISQKGLRVSAKNRILAHAESSPALLRAASDPALTTLESLYEDPGAMDGFELAFQFNPPGKAKPVTVRNRYVPALYRILKECHKLIPPDTRFAEREHFVWMNTQLRQDIAQNWHKPDMPEELRAKVMADLESQIVKLEE